MSGPETEKAHGPKEESFERRMRKVMINNEQCFSDIDFYFCVATILNQYSFSAIDNPNNNDIKKMF